MYSHKFIALLNWNTEGAVLAKDNMPSVVFSYGVTESKQFAYRTGSSFANTNDAGAGLSHVH